MWASCATSRNQRAFTEAGQTGRLLGGKGHGMKWRFVCSFIWLALLCAPVQATELRVLASWDDTHPARRILLNTYLKNVEAASKGDVSFKLSGPETAPPFEQLQPVSAGVFQMLFTHPGY